VSERPRDFLDRAGWAVTKALRWIGAAFITISLLGAAAAAIEGNWSLARGLLLYALFQAFAFAAAIAVGTWAFAPRKPNPRHPTSKEARRGL
jgi:hypothetical protein